MKNIASVIGALAVFAIVLFLLTCAVELFWNWLLVSAFAFPPIDLLTAFELACLGALAVTALSLHQL